MRNNARGANRGKHSRAPQELQAQWGDDKVESDIGCRQEKLLGAWRYPEDSQRNNAEDQAKPHFIKKHYTA